MAARPLKLPPTSGTFYLKKLGPLLSKHRSLSGLSRKQVSRELLAKIRAARASQSWTPFLNLLGQKASRGLLALERGTLLGEKVFIPDTALLAAAYKVPPLMLDPARSRPIAGDVLVEQIPKFQVVSRVGVPSYGFQSRYSVPQRQLIGTDNLVIVHLELGKGKSLIKEAHSDFHQHPGEEILFLEDGYTVVWFAETGLRCSLRQNSFVHFDSNQMHSAWSPPGGFSSSFIVRYYPPRNKCLTKEVAVSLQLFHETKSRTTEVLDRQGLASFLKLLRSGLASSLNTSESLSLNDLVRRASAKGVDISRSKLDRIHHGRGTILRSDLKKVADVYEIEPMILYNFLLPDCKPTYAVTIDTKTDMETISERFLSKGIKYELPRRRLRSSQAMVALLRLAPGAKTKPNNHPGQEIVKPISGRVIIEFENTISEVAKGEFAHFFSYRTHRMVNKTKRTTKLLVMRFPCP